MKYNKTILCEECRYAIWDSVYDGDEDIDYIDGCEKSNKIFDITTLNNHNCKDYRSINEVSKFRIN